MREEAKHGETDRIYKRFYADAAVVEEIVRDFVGGAWTRELDFATLERLPAEMVDPVLPVVRQADMVWRVRFRDRPLHVVLLFEFQSSPDPNMAVRIAVATGVFYRELAVLRRREPGVGAHVVVPVVVKSFEGKWTAARSMAEWLADGVPEELVPYATGQCYGLLDESAEAKKAGGGGVVRAAMALRRERDPERLAALVRSLDAQLGASSVARDALAEWIRSQMINSGATEAEVAHLDTLREAGEMYVNQFQETFRDGVKQGLAQGIEQGLAQGIEQGRAQGVEQGLARGVKQGRAQGVEQGLARGVKQGRAQGLAQGVEQGRAQGLARGVKQGLAQGLKQAHVDMARWKFGGETAERLAELLEGMGDADRVSRIGRLLVECETGEELIAKAVQI